MMIYKKYVKQILDYLFSLIAIIVLLPIFILIALVVYIDDHGSIIFIQKRVGKDKKIFNLYKFRTMKMSTPHDMPTHLLNNPETYITRVGKALRKTSLDELPQLFNILFGQMSFIGPRPALWNQNDLIEERDKYGVNLLKPGLSGWAQINGRDELPIKQKVKFDAEYADNISLIFDLKCLFGTIEAIITTKGQKEGGTGGL